MVGLRGILFWTCLRGNVPGGFGGSHTSSSIFTIMAGVVSVPLALSALSCSVSKGVGYSLAPGT